MQPAKGHSACVHFGTAFAAKPTKTGRQRYNKAEGKVANPVNAEMLSTLTGLDLSVQSGAILFVVY